MATHNELGKWGEATAEQLLRDKGYTIVERDWHSGHRDIDIIARTPDNATLVFDNQETSTVDMALVSLAFQYDNQAAAIRSIKGDDKAQATAVYNLNGQRISPLSTQNRKGIYIINNKKIVK